MEFKEMEMAALEARKAEIAELINSEDADLNAIEEEVRAINAEIDSRKEAAAKREELRKAVVQGMGEVIDEKKEEREMENIEIRNTKAYIDAYAEYIKTGKADEVRALTSTNDTTPNGTASVPVPDFVYEEVKRAWDDEAIMRYVRKAYVAGNLKVGFEISATGAVIHKEGAAAPSEETLTLGIVQIVPENIKKWISVSDEVMDLRGEAFLRYIYAELTHQIAKKAADTIVALISAAGTQSTATAVGVPAIKATQITQGLVASAMGYLSDEASQPVVMMNKLTWSAFKAAQYAGNYATDIFENLPVVFNNTITEFSAATSGVPYVLVGDLGYGALANFPDGEEIRFTFDEYSLSEKDLVKIVGKEFVGLGIVAPGAFVKITK